MTEKEPKSGAEITIHNQTGLEAPHIVKFDFRGTPDLFVKQLNKAIKLLKQTKCPGFKENDISDGYHTFGELYEFRKQYNAALFNEWAKQGLYQVHKSLKHYDGEDCFGGGWFIVCAMLPDGQISNHYKISEWDLFQIPEEEKSLWEFDGHTGKDVIQRLKALNQTK